VARFYLGVPASSIPSERLFSAAGSVITKKRASLADDIVDDVLFVKFNLDSLCAPDGTKESRDKIDLAYLRH
jgi:hypothetical protein